MASCCAWRLTPEREGGGSRRGRGWALYPNTRCSSQPLKGLVDVELVGANSPPNRAPHPTKISCPAATECTEEPGITLLRVCQVVNACLLPSQPIENGEPWGCLEFFTSHSPESHWRTGLQRVFEILLQTSFSAPPAWELECNLYKEAIKLSLAVDRAGWTRHLEVVFFRWSPDV